MVFPKTLQSTEMLQKWLHTDFGAFGSQQPLLVPTHGFKFFLQQTDKAVHPQ